MVEFETVRESANKSWVRTPFPVPQNVWASFVFRIFPELDFTQNGFIISRKEKFLNRWPDKPVDEIANGRDGDYYKHAYLPHCERWGVNVHDWGLIHVPDEETYHLDQIEADLAEHPNSRTVLLTRLNQIHGNTIDKIFNNFLRELEKEPKTTKELRKNLRTRFSSGFLSILPLKLSYREPSDGYYAIGTLPSFVDSYGNDYHELVTLTALDFLRNLDRVLGTEKDLSADLSTSIYSVIYGWYHHLISEKGKQDYYPRKFINIDDLLFTYSEGSKLLPQSNSL